MLKGKYEVGFGILGPEWTSSMVDCGTGNIFFMSKQYPKQQQSAKEGWDNDINWNSWDDRPSIILNELKELKETR